jgi:hypothetical protein
VAALSLGIGLPALVFSLIDSALLLAVPAVLVAAGSPGCPVPALPQPVDPQVALAAEQPPDHPESRG